MIKFFCQKKKKKMGQLDLTESENESSSLKLTKKNSF